MRAVVMEDTRKVAVREVPKPEADGVKALLKVSAAGICGSDLAAWAAGRYVGTTLGHEFCGVVLDPGNSRELKAGDRVAAIEINPCGQCEYCKSGRENLCAAVMDDSPGLGANGGFAEYANVRADMLKKLPNNVSDIQGAMIEPASISMHAVRKAGVQAGSKVLVTGAGPIGLFAVAAAKALGASFVAVTDISEPRLKFADARPDIDCAFNASDKDLNEKLMAASGGGFDCAIDCVGLASAVATAISTLKRGGKLAFVGAHDLEMKIDTFSIFFKELQVFGCIFFVPEEFEMVIDLVSRGRLDMTGINSSLIAFEDAQKYFEQLATGTSLERKVILRP